MSRPKVSARIVSRTCLVKWLYVLSKRSMRFATVRAFRSLECGLIAEVATKASIDWLRLLLGKALPALALCFALATFAGLRSEEILRLEYWDLDRRSLHLIARGHS